MLNVLVKRLKNSINGNPVSISFIVTFIFEINISFWYGKDKANYGFVYAHNFYDFEHKNIELTLNITPKGRKSISDIAGQLMKDSINNAI